MAEGKAFGNVVKSLLDGLEGYANAKTVVGDPITVGDTTLIPLIDITIGVGAGAGLNDDKKKSREGGGMGAKLTTTGIIMVRDGAVRIIDVKEQNTAMKVLDLIPEIVNRFTGKTKISEEDVADAVAKVKAEAAGESEE
ncbi:MAG: sporulation protein [Lachnospiraceae bacterium]|nr:sporulation protein [Lachnospiraceae bacterium]